MITVVMAWNTSLIVNFAPGIVISLISFCSLSTACLSTSARCFTLREGSGGGGIGGGGGGGIGGRGAEGGDRREGIGGRGAEGGERRVEIGGRG